MKEDRFDRAQFTVGNGEELKAPAVEYVHTPGIPELLSQLKISLIVSTYQAQRVLLFSVKDGRLSMLMRTFPRPTGLCVEQDRLALMCRNQLWLFETTSEVWNEEGEKLPHDLVYVPRRSYVMGDIAGHEVRWINGKLVIIATRFSALVTPSDKYSFEPLWKPPFVSTLSAEDKCHMNGMAVDQNGVRYLTALGATDKADGWRDNKSAGGVIMHVPSGEFLCRGMAMPHSPRLYGGMLWVLESGMGELQMVDQKTGVREPVIRLPGYLRGLSFHGNYAFVGLSQMREKRTFGGLPIETLYPQLDCAIHIIDLRRGVDVGYIKFTKGIEELFEIQPLVGVLSPHMIGFEEDTINGLYVLPPR